MSPDYKDVMALANAVEALRVERSFTTQIDFRVSSKGQVYVQGAQALSWVMSLDSNPDVGEWYGESPQRNVSVEIDGITFMAIERHR